MKKKKIKSANGDGIFVGWANDKDPDSDDRTLWITEGKCLGDFYGKNIALSKKEALKLSNEIENIIRLSEKRCPICGYTKKDAKIFGDHYLCDGKISK